MVQTSIGNTLAFGFPGEHGNGQPYVADAAVVGAAIKFGEVAFASDSGTIGPKNETYKTFAGIVVSPHQHVRQVLPTDTTSIEAAVGDTVSVAKKGAWYIEISGLASDPNVKVGNTVYYVTASGALTLDSTSATSLGTIIDFVKESYTVSSATKYRVSALIRLA